MSAPAPPGSGPSYPPPQPYPPYYPSLPLETVLTRRGLWFVNLVGVVIMWIGYLWSLPTQDALILDFTRFLVISGALLGAVGSLAGALGSKRTTDMQNLGLFLWAGFLVVGATFLLALIR